MTKLNQTGWATSRGPRAITLRSLLHFTMPISVLLFCASFNWSYAEWLSPVWGYLGLTYRSPDPFLLTLGYVLAAGLCVVSPRKIQRPSQVIYWLLYFSVYIPGLFAPLFMQLDQKLTLLLLQLSMTGGMLLIALSYHVKLLAVHRHPLSAHLFWMIFVTLFLSCNVILLIAFHGSIHFASLKEVYGVRFREQQIAQQNLGIRYISSALSSVMNPFLITCGLIVRRRKLVALGIAGQILVYATAAMKSVLLSPVLIVAFYYSLKKDRGGWAPTVGLLFTSLFFVLTALAIGTSQGFVFNLASATLLRSFAIPGVSVGEYQHFFESFPHTYLAHVTGINWLISDPYDLSTGKEIGVFYAGDQGKYGAPNANASFFAMDGIAGFGLVGIPIMGVICAMMFSALDSCARKYSIAFSASALTMCAVSLTNGSLFTSFLSGGVMAFMLLFVFMPRYLLDIDVA
jgi:hypothetical protein